MVVFPANEALCIQRRGDRFLAAASFPPRQAAVIFAVGQGRGRHLALAREGDPFLARRRRNLGRLGPQIVEDLPLIRGHVAWQPALDVAATVDVGLVPTTALVTVLVTTTLAAVVGR